MRRLFSLLLIATTWLTLAPGAGPSSAQTGIAREWRRHREEMSRR